MSSLIAALFLIMGLIGVFRPNFFYKTELLTPEQLQRNRRIWKKGGIVLIILGIVQLALSFLRK